MQDLSAKLKSEFLVVERENDGIKTAEYLRISDFEPATNTAAYAVKVVDWARDVNSASCIKNYIYFDTSFIAYIPYSTLLLAKSITEQEFSSAVIQCIINTASFVKDKNDAFSIGYKNTPERSALMQHLITNMKPGLVLT